MEQNSIAETAETEQPRKQRFRQRGRRLFGSILLFAAILFLANLVRNWLQDRAFEKLLIGTWNSDHIQADSSVSTFITEFQPDGTMHHFDQLKPFTSDGRLMHGPRWRVQGGILYLDYDDARSASSRIWQSVDDVAGLFTRKKSLTRQRFLLELTHEKKITITPYPDKRDKAGWVGGSWTLTREN